MKSNICSQIKTRTGDNMLSETIPDKELQGFNSYNTITIHTPLAHAIGTNETIVYGALVSKYFYYRNRDKLTDDGYFMVSENDLCESTTISGKPLTRLMKNIESNGLIKQELRGMPAKKYVHIVHDDALLMRLLNNGANSAASIHKETTEAHFWGEENENIADNDNDGLLSVFSNRHKLYVNRPLAHSIGLDPAVAWAVIVTKYFQCQRYDTLREDRSFYITEADFEDLCGYKRRKQKAAIDKLIEYGFIQTTVAGVPAKRYFQIIITAQKLNEVIMSGMDTSRNIYSMTSEAAERSIREKEEAERSRPATAEEIDEFIISKLGHKQEEIQFVQNGGTSLYNTENQDRTYGSFKFVQNGGTRMDKTSEHTINLNIYNHNISQSVCNISDGQTDKLSNEKESFSYSSAKELLKEHIEYAWYENHFKTENDEKTNIVSISQVNFVVDLMLDALCRASRVGHISLSKNGKTVTYNDIREHFLEKLKKRHLEYVFEKIDLENVKNIRAYLLTSLYNVTDDMDMVNTQQTVPKENTFDIDLWYKLAEYDPDDITLKGGE